MFGNYNYRVFTLAGGMNAEKSRMKISIKGLVFT